MHFTYLHKNIFCRLVFAGKKTFHYKIRTRYLVFKVLVSLVFQKNIFFDLLQSVTLNISMYNYCMIKKMKINLTSDVHIDI